MGTQKITYIGSFPPPYGGVTVKNALLYKHLSSILEMAVLDLQSVKKLKLHALFDFVQGLLSRDGSLVVGTSADWRYRLTSILYYFNKKKMKRSILVVMGGRTPDDPAYIRRMNGYRRVYVETESMKRSFEKMGARNIAIYPNCREQSFTQIKETTDCVSCVFFSLISPDKGMRIVLSSARCLPQIIFHFYGRIEKGYEEEFYEEIGSLSNVHYHGVFDSASGDVISELNKYDVHLFPTLCPNEGVPGVLAETKIAGVPTIASDRSYNRELIEDGVDGVLTHEDTSEELVQILDGLSRDPGRLNRMKKAALKSADRFVIDRYLEQIVDDLTKTSERKSNGPDGCL